MEVTQVTPSTTVTQRSTTDIHEVSPGNETVVEITVTGIEDNKKPSILTPFTEELTVSMIFCQSRFEGLIKSRDQRVCTNEIIKMTAIG